MQAAITKCVEKVEARRKAEERFTRPSEEDKDDHSIRELTNNHN